MASNSQKKIAQQNAATLKTHLAGFFAVLLASLLLNFLFYKIAVKFVVFNLPALACLYSMYRGSKPVYEYIKNPYYKAGVNDEYVPQLISEGFDLSSGGVMEYMFDLVYLTGLLDILTPLLGMKVWYLLFAVPVFAIYKGWFLVDMAKSMLQARNKKALDAEPVETKSKRQQKLEKRGDKAKVRYR